MIPLLLLPGTWKLSPGNTLMVHQEHCWPTGKPSVIINFIIPTQGHRPSKSYKNKMQTHRKHALQRCLNGVHPQSILFEPLFFVMIWPSCPSLHWTSALLDQVNIAPSTNTSLSLPLFLFSS